MSAVLSETRIAELLRPYLGDAPMPAGLYGKLSVYLDLLLRWNARTNLTAIREPERIVERHFGEGLFCGLQMATRLSADASLLDYGSGAGFPGLPIQLLLPEMRVTLAESQGKKASFLREAIRTLSLPHTEVWAGRVEDLPMGQTFAAVTLRAVDRMEHAIASAHMRVLPGGWLVTLAETASPETPECSTWNIPLPGNSPGFVTIKQAVGSKL